MKNSTEQKGLDSVVPSAELPRIEKKTCSKCRIEKSVDDFYINSRNRNLRQSQCKRCKREGKRKTEVAFISDGVPNGFICCRRCNELKVNNSDNFHKSKITDSSKVLLCKSCRNKANKENSIKTRSDCRKRHKKWRDKNRGKVRAYQKMRKKLVLRATPKWFESEKVNEVYKQAVKRGWQVDHIVPIISDLVCGLHCYDNLQIMEPSINMSKKNRYWPDMPEEK